MSTPWYRRLFFREPPSDFTEIRSKAEHGDPAAQFALGLSISLFPVGGENDTDAAKWYRVAAEQGHTLAQYNLATMYANGQGVTVDEAEASKWYLRAADLGDAGAQFQMGKRCHRGSYSESKPAAAEARIEAFKWFNLAAAQGYATSDAYLERTNLMLNREEIDEGRRRTATFIARTAPAEVV